MLVRLTRWRELAGLLAVVLLLSVAVSMTSLLLNGTVGAFASSSGAGSNIVILSGGGRVPETGAVDLASLKNATHLPGVEAYSPEVYAPADLGGQVVVARGVNYSQFAALQPVSPVNGLLIGLGPNTVYVGEGLARSEGVAVGSDITLRGLLANSSVRVQVAAVISAGAPYDSEVISSIPVAQALRGLSPGQVTFLRLKVDPSTFNRALLVQTVGTGGLGEANPLVREVQLAPTTLLISIVPPDSQTPSLTAVLGRGLGLVESVFAALDGVVLLVSLLAVYFAASYWVGSVRPVTDVLTAVGLGRGRLTGQLLAVAVPPSLLAGALGYLVAYLVAGALAAQGSLMFFFQPIQIAFTPSSLLISALGPAVAVAVSIAASVVWSESARGSKGGG